MRYAVLINDLVETTILLDPEHVDAYDQAIEGTLVLIDNRPDVDTGWSYVGGEWVAPTPSVIQSQRLVPISHWLLRLTNDEVKAFNKLNVQRKTLLIDADAFEDPALQWLVYWDIFMTHFERLTNEIDLSHPSTIQGLQMFAALAGINEDRLDELLLP